MPIGDGAEILQRMMGIHLFGKKRKSNCSVNDFRPFLKHIFAKSASDSHTIVICLESRLSIEEERKSRADVNAAYQNADGVGRVSDKLSGTVILDQQLPMEYNRESTRRSVVTASKKLDVIHQPDSQNTYKRTTSRRFEHK